MPHSFRTRIDAEIDGKIVKYDDVYPDQMPARIRMYRNTLPEQSKGKPWAIFIYQSARRLARKGKPDKWYTDLNKQIETAARKLGL